MADRPVFVREVAHLERPLILVRDDIEKAPHLVRHEAHCLHYVCGRAAHRIDPGFHFAEIRRLDPRTQASPRFAPPGRYCDGWPGCGCGNGIGSNPMPRAIVSIATT